MTRWPTLDPGSQARADTREVPDSGDPGEVPDQADPGGPGVDTGDPGLLVHLVGLQEVLQVVHRVAHQVATHPIK